RTHDKAVLVDTLRDNPNRQQGRVLCGSSNWSQGAMHNSQEQTLVIDDPAVANLYLQRATAAYVEDGNPLDRPVDCVIAIDRSGSMLQTLPDGVTSKIALAREAATVFLDALHHD